MRIALFFKLIVLSLCAALLSFALVPEVMLMGALKIMALGTVLSIAVAAFYPEIRGIRAGDTVSVVADSGIPSIIGRLGTAAAAGRKNQQIKITLSNGSEVIGVVESYTGLVSPPRIRVLYEERLVE
jgi:hypothetical protein